MLIQRIMIYMARVRVRRPGDLGRHQPPGPAGGGQGGVVQGADQKAGPGERRRRAEGGGVPGRQGRRGSASPRRRELNGNGHSKNAGQRHPAQREPGGHGPHQPAGQDGADAGAGVHLRRPAVRQRGGPGLGAV